MRSPLFLEKRERLDYRLSSDCRSTSDRPDTRGRLNLGTSGSEVCARVIQERTLVRADLLQARSKAQAAAMTEEPTLASIGPTVSKGSNPDSQAKSYGQF